MSVRILMLNKFSPRCVAIFLCLTICALFVLGGYIGLQDTLVCAVCVICTIFYFTRLVVKRKTPIVLKKPDVQEKWYTEEFTSPIAWYVCCLARTAPTAS